jgi:hypothetical protein
MYSYFLFEAQDLTLIYADEVATQPEIIVCFNLSLVPFSSHCCVFIIVCLLACLYFVFCVQVRHYGEGDLDKPSLVLQGIAAAHDQATADALKEEVGCGEWKYGVISWARRIHVFGQLRLMVFACVSSGLRCLSVPLSNAY